MMPLRNKQLPDSIMNEMYSSMPYSNDSMWICPANERQCYNVTQSLIGWAHSQNDPCILGQTRPADLPLTIFLFKDYT